MNRLLWIVISLNVQTNCDAGDTLKRLNIMKSKRFYSILDRMPKGVLHHNHMDCMEDLEFVRIGSFR